MKHFFTLVMVFFGAYTALAQPNDNSRWQNNQQSRLSISSMSKEAVRVLVNGKDYNTRGNDDELLISNIRPGYHSVKIYRQGRSRSNGWGKPNRNMQVLYESNIYVKPQYHVDITINRFGKVFIDERQINSGYYEDYDDHNGGWGNNDGYNQPMNSSSFEQFKRTLRNESYDNTRVTVAKQTIDNNRFSAAQVKELVQLFSFENSKLDMAKYCYRNTIDRNNYFVVNDALTYSSSREELARYIQSYRQ